MAYHLRFIFGKMTTETLLQVGQVILCIRETPGSIIAFHKHLPQKIEWFPLPQNGRSK